MPNLTKNKIIFGVVAIVILIVVIAVSCSSCNRESFEDAVRFGQMDLEKGNYEDAIYHLERAADLEPENVTVLVNLGMAYFMAEQFDSAANTFEKAVLVEPTEEMREALAVARLKQNSYDEAIDVYTRAITEFGRKPDLIAGLAACHMLKGNKKHASDLLREAISDDPNNPVARYNMAVLKADNNEIVEAANNFIVFFDFADPVANAEQLEQARLRFATIAEIYPKEKKAEAQEHFTAAIGYYKQQNYVAAFKETLIATSLNPTDPNFIAFLSGICKKVGKLENVDRLNNRLKNGFPEYWQSINAK